MTEENPTRGRGGYRDLNTIPSNTPQLHVARPEQFRQVKLMANYVAIKPQGDTAVQHCYRIDYAPEVESTELMRILFRGAARNLFTRMPFFDGAHECRTRQRLTDAVSTADVTTDFGGDNQTYNVKFTHTGTIATGSELMRSFNIELKAYLRLLGYFQPQPGLHVHPGQAHQIGQDLKILRGFRTAASLNKSNKILMNFEGSHKLLQNKNVRDVLMDINQRSRGNFQETARSELVGKLVITNYNKQAYRIEDIDFSSNTNSTFSMRDGTLVTFADYLRTKHNITVRDPQQPLLTVVPNNNRRRGIESTETELKLVPEVCNIAGLTENQRRDNRLKMDLIRASQINPQERVAQLRTFLNALHSNQEVRNLLNEYGYNYESDGLKFKGHELPQTALALSAEQAAREVTAWPRADASSGDFRAQSLAVTPTITKMALVIGASELRNKRTIEAQLKSGFQKVGLRAGEVEAHDLEGDSPAHFSRKMRSLPASLTLAIVVLSSQNKAIYDVIKKAASCETGLVTQVVTSKLMTDQRKAGSAAVKIAIQIAAKVGGEPWRVDLQALKSTMVCGYDTYHDTANRGRSYGALIASMNEHYSKWYSSADQHDRLDEMSTQIATNILNALTKYKEFNKKLPERVVIYRDGVGEGQVEHVYNTELKSISEKIKSVGSNIKLTVILVNKRIGARFYMTNDEGRTFINPQPGTVVDHEVTKPGRYDFYLISQSTRQGTITPTYYNIIHDENGFPPEIHQKMAYKFCFLYYNWSGSVRVPAPCQYAHKLAYLCGEHLHAQPNSTLSNRLHFL